MLTNETIAKTKRPTLLKFSRAMVEAVHSIKTEKESTKAIFSKNLRLTDPEGLERAYRAYTAVFPDNLMPSPDGVKTMLDDLAIRDTRAVGANPNAFVDPSFIRELESSGFIKQLYR